MPAANTALQRVRAIIEGCRAHGVEPDYVPVPVDDYKEIMGALVLQHGPAPLINPTIQGVLIRVDRSPYPWGQFPA